LRKIKTLETLEGFFETQELQSDEIHKGKMVSCASCGLYKYALSPKIQPFGDFKKKVMVIGEAPGEVEDRRNKPWQGKVGTLLQKNLKNLKDLKDLKDLKFDLFKDAVSYNSVNCRPSNNETPDSYKIECCRKKVQAAIKGYKPNVIILLGNCAVESVIGKYWLKDLGGITKWRGWCIPDQNYNAWICPTFHPSYIDRQYKDDVSRLIWKRDLKRALSYINKPVPKQPNFSDFITFCFTNDQVRQAIKTIKLKGKKRFISFDYETTGLKPYRKGHRLVCTSVAVSPTECYVWENTEKRNRMFAPVLKTATIKKSSHNLQFEDQWTQECIKVKIGGWEWCSMNNAHILDNRKGIVSLKFQTYIHFGIADYDGDVAPFLKSIDKNKHGANSFNKIDQFIKTYGIEKLFEYCGKDSIFGYMLTLKQMKEMGYGTNNK